jgi:hypothetical protein
MSTTRRSLIPAAIPQFGLVAEEIVKIDPALVVRDENGQIYTVRYKAINAMLLNEFLKAHRKLEEQQTTIERQQKQIDALIAGLQKVTARVELAKPAPRVVSDRYRQPRSEFLSREQCCRVPAVKVNRSQGRTKSRRQGYRNQESRLHRLRQSQQRFSGQM